MSKSKNKFLSCLRSILLHEKNGSEESVVEKHFEEIIGEDLRQTLVSFGYSGLGDRFFLSEHAEIITECYGRFYGVALDVQRPLVSLINTTSRHKGWHRIPI